MTKARDLANAATALSAVDATELAFVDGVTSAIQTQMDAKAPSSTAVTLTGTQTLTNKTLTNPVISSVINNTLTSTTGDIIYASAANTPARLGIGSSAQVLTVASGVPSWATPASGLTLINTTTFSGASSVAIDSIFTSTYSNYLIQTNFTSAGGTDQMVKMRLRASGTAASGSDYIQDGVRAYPSAVAYVGGTDSAFNLHNISTVNANNASHTFNLLGPNLANRTQIHSMGHGYTSTSFGTNSIQVSGSHSVSTAYDGFIIFVASGNIAGTVKIYGYQN
jgi:hypothetical protein